jgi:hypothetical protein
MYSLVIIRPIRTGPLGHGDDKYEERHEWRGFASKDEAEKFFLERDKKEYNSDLNRGYTLWSIHLTATTPHTKKEIACSKCKRSIR